MDLRDKIINNIESLTAEDFDAINQSPELIDFFVESVVIKRPSLSFLNKVNAELMRKIFFVEPFFRLFLDYIKEEEPNANLLTLFNTNYFYDDDFITPENEEMALKTIRKIQDEMFDEATQLLLSDDEDIEFVTDNKRVIEFIIKNKMYNRCGCIRLKPEEVTPEIESFLIETIENTEDVILAIRTPKIMDYCMKNNCIHRIINSFNTKIPEELALIKEAFEKDAVTYMQIKGGPLQYHLIDSPKFIIQKLLAGDYLTDQQTEYVKNNPNLIKQIIEIISNATENIPSGISSLADDIMEIKIALIKYNIDSISWYDETVLEHYINKEEEEIIKILNEKHDLLIEAINYFYDKRPDCLMSIAKKIILNDNLGEIRDVTFKHLPNVDYSTLLVGYINGFYEDSVTAIPILTKYIEENKVDLIIEDKDIYLKSMDFNVYILILKCITKENLEYLIPNLDTLSRNPKYTKEQLQEIYKIVIDKSLLYKSEAIGSYYFYFKANANPKDIERIVEHASDLKLNFGNIYELYDFENLKGKPVDELIRIFDGSIINLYSFGVVSNIVTKDNIDIIRWMLDSPTLEVNETLYEKLISLYYDYRRVDLEDEYKSIVKEFFIKTGNIPAKYTSNFDNETIQKATLDCDDEIYNNNADYFTPENYSKEYYLLLFEKIKERMKDGKKVNFNIFVNCRKNIFGMGDILENGNINVDLLHWDATDMAFSNIVGLLKNPLFNEYIRNIVIPTINIDVINQRKFSVKELATFDPEFINRLNELSQEGAIFDSIILSLLSVENVSEYEDFLNNLYEKDLINYQTINGNSFEIINPLIDKIITNKIIPNADLLAKNLDNLFKYKPEYEAMIAKQIDSEESLSFVFAKKDYKKYPLVFQSILKALKDGRLKYQCNNDLLDVDILKAILDHNSEDIKGIINFLIHNNQDPPKEVFEFLIPYYCKDKNLSEKNIEFIYKEYGNTIISLLDSENFLHLCNQDLETIKKVFALLEPRKLDLAMIQGINNSIRQNIFTATNPQVMTIFTTVLAKIQNGKFEEERDYYLQLLAPAVPDGLEEKILLTFDNELLLVYSKDKIAFLNLLFDRLKENQNIYADLFNIITTSYIMLERNEFSRQDDIFRDTTVPFVYDKKILYDTLFKELLQNERRQLFIILGIPTYLSYDREYSLDDLDEYAIDYYTIQFISGVDITDKLSKEQLIQVKKNIKVLKNRFNEYLDEKSCNHGEILSGNPLPEEFMHYLDDPVFTSKLKKNLIIGSREKNLAKEFTQLNVDALLENIMQDEEKYNLLLEVIKKYRILDWFNYFSPTISKLSIGNQIDNLYGFINAFNQIYEAEKKSIMKNKLPKVLEEIENMRKLGVSEEEIQKYKNQALRVQFNAYRILKYCSIYSAIPNCYKVLLGLEDFEIIKLNHDPYPGSGSPEERLARACEVHLKAIKQQEISIPSFITDEKLSSGKTLRVIIGNRTHPRNMSHGERTGACMRAYGISDSERQGRPRSKDLYEFSGTNFNGFHITLVDPETDEYVSRVSGFRNGNTVFLNQLRNSVNGNYSDEDVIEAMRLASQKIIEQSKDSEYPIENVVASPCYALLHHETQELSDSDIGRGVYEGYKDVTQNAVVLATTGEDGKAVELELDSSRHPHYRCVRVLPKEIVGDLSDSMKINLQRITAIRQVLENEEDPEYLKGIDIDTDALDEIYVYTIIGQDWFIALDSNLNIKSDIITLDDRAQLEFDEAMQKVEAFKTGKYTMTGGTPNGKQL